MNVEEGLVTVTVNPAAAEAAGKASIHSPLNRAAGNASSPLTRTGTVTVPPSMGSSAILNDVLRSSPTPSDQPTATVQLERITGVQQAWLNVVGHAGWAVSLLLIVYLHEAASYEHDYNDHGGVTLESQAIDGFRVLHATVVFLGLALSVGSLVLCLPSAIAQRRAGVWLHPQQYWVIPMCCASVLMWIPDLSVIFQGNRNDDHDHNHEDPVVRHLKSAASAALVALISWYVNCQLSARFWPVCPGRGYERKFYGAPVAIGVGLGVVMLFCSMHNDDTRPSLVAAFVFQLKYMQTPHNEGIAALFSNVVCNLGFVVLNIRLFRLQQAGTLLQ